MYGISITSCNNNTAVLYNCNFEEDEEGMYDMIDAMAYVGRYLHLQHTNHISDDELWRDIASYFDLDILTENKDDCCGLYICDDDYEGLESLTEQTDYNAELSYDNFTIFQNPTISGFDEDFDENSPVYEMSDELYQAWNFDGDIVLNTSQFFEFTEALEEYYDEYRLYIRHGAEEYTMYFPEGTVIEY